ncbi:MAG: permease-like cell division protein FtsX [Roseivirga sp.]
MAKEEKKYKRKKKKVGSYQYGSVVFSIFLALVVIGLLGMLMLFVNGLSTAVKDNFEISIFLNKNVTKNQRSRIENELTASPYLLQKEGQSNVRFKPKEDAAAEFIKDTGEDFAEFLGDNPFRDALIININADYQENTKLDSISNHIEAISGVFEVAYSPSILDKIEKNGTRLSLYLLILAIVLLIIVVLLINNTIKLALFSQRFLIRSMQLVGATSGFIRKPFLSRSFLHGALAGLIASAVLFAALQFFYDQIEGLEELQQEIYIFALLGALVILGSLIALFSTRRAMNKYLKLSLDELY